MSGERALHTYRVHRRMDPVAGIAFAFSGQHGFRSHGVARRGETRPRYVSCLYSRVCVSCVECGWAMWRVHTGVLAFVPSVARSGGPYLPSICVYVPSSLARSRDAIMRVGRLVRPARPRQRPQRVPRHRPHPGHPRTTGDYARLLDIQGEIFRPKMGQIAGFRL